MTLRTPSRPSPRRLPLPPPGGAPTGLWSALLLALVLAARPAPAAAVPAGAAQPPAGPRAVGVEAVLPVNDKAPGGNAALFVGVNEFREASGLQPLRFAVDDAVAQAHLFVIELKLVPPANCFLCLGGAPAGDAAKAQLKALAAAGAKATDASRATMLDALLAVQQIPTDRADLLVVSFSTHGFEDRGIPYAMPADGLRRLLRQTAVDLNDLEQQLAQSKAGKRLLIVDACREKALADGKGAGDPPMTEAFRKSLAAADGQAVLASCDAGQVSFENPALGHGVFTHFLLEGLRGRAAADANGFITLGGVGEYVARSVNDWTVRNRPAADRAAAQRPWFKGPEGARAIPLAVDPKAKDKRDAFRADVERTVAGLKSRIERKGPFTYALWERLADVLERLDPADEQGRNLLKAAADFAADRLTADVAVAYFEKVLPKYDPPKPAAPAASVAPTTPVANPAAPTPPRPTQPQPALPSAGGPATPPAASPPTATPPAVTPGPAATGAAGLARPPAAAGVPALPAPRSAFNGGLEGTTWVVGDEDGDQYTFSFLKDGVLQYRMGPATRTNGTWRQNSQSVQITINDGYASFDGTLQDGRLAGQAAFKPRAGRRKWAAVIQ